MTTREVGSGATDAETGVLCDLSNRDGRSLEERFKVLSLLNAEPGKDRGQILEGSGIKKKLVWWAACCRRNGQPSICLHSG